MNSDVKIAFVDEGPRSEQFDKIVNTALIHAGLSREDVVYLGLAEVDKLANLPKLETVVALGARATMQLLGGALPTLGNSRDKEAFLNQWRGSVVNVGDLRAKPSNVPEDYMTTIELEPLGFLQNRVNVIPTYHPSVVNQRFEYHPLFMLDVAKANKPIPLKVYRTWYVNKPSKLLELVDAKVDLIAVDTEMDPPIIGIVTEDEVHVFLWTPESNRFLEPLLINNRVLKVAHNWSHDHAFIRRRFGIAVSRPIFDTYGGAHILNTAMPKDLSPGIATRFTNWPYHKWLVAHNPLVYCGLDAIVSYDAYWPQITELHSRKLAPIAEFDHQLLMALMEMQAFGFKIDESRRAEAAMELALDLRDKSLELQQLVQPVIDEKIGKFEKPHLFKQERKCPCCGGGKLQRSHCAVCYFDFDDMQPVELTRELANHCGFKTIKALKEAFPTCQSCNGSGRVSVNLPFNPDSSDQVADVIYRGLGIKPRRFKGKETVKAAQLDPIKDKHVIIERIVEVSKVRADADTVDRLSAGPDGRLHCVFDPWGTQSGRVAGKEGLVEVGTNPMNIPKKARIFVVPDAGHILLYPDMAQIEARCVALLSGDKLLKSAFTDPIDWPGNPKHGMIDSHTRVMQLMLEMAGVEITRDGSKRLTYAGMYGGEAPQITKELNAENFRKGINKYYEVSEVDRMLEAFFYVFSGVRQWHRSVLDEVLRTRRLRCPFTGRERTWAGRIVDRKSGELSRETSKEVWSFLPQHMGAYVLGTGLIELRKSEDWQTLFMPLIHVHDALLMQAPIDKLELAKERATSYLSRELWGMYFPSDIKTGHNWLEASG